MKLKHTLLTITALNAFSLLSGADQPSTPSIIPVVRKPLLTAQIEGGKTVDRAEIKEIEMLNPMKGGLHLHPCPVVGYIVEGQILFQIEGQPEKNLKAGDAFFEPANVRISHFDNMGPGKAKFVACYLLSSDDHALIKMLPEK
jgi:quercetin dioxygenase-like cupin family protein